MTPGLALVGRHSIVLDPLFSPTCGRMCSQTRLYRQMTPWPRASNLSTTSGVGELPVIASQHLRDTPLIPVTHRVIDLVRYCRRAAATEQGWFVIPFGWSNDGCSPALSASDLLHHCLECSIMSSTVQVGSCVHCHCVRGRGPIGKILSEEESPLLPPEGKKGSTTCGSDAGSNPAGSSVLLPILLTVSRAVSADKIEDTELEINTIRSCCLLKNVDTCFRHRNAVPQRC